MKDQDPPAFAGPSEFGQSVTVSVNPDSLPQDGASQSLVTVTVRDKDSAPMRNVTLRVETRVEGTPVDFGSLSARSIVTDSNGRATFIYTAPAAPAVAVDTFTVVDIGATPVGSDFNNAVLRTAAIRLTPPGVIVPPSNLRPVFTVTPSAPQDHQTALFDASASQGSIVDYQWNFGDGDRGSGRTAQHAYDAAGTYVATLTVVDPYGRTASVSQSITVSAGVSPTAAFVFSPTNPLPTQQVFFNASASRPAPGRTLTSYQWDFGDGTSGSGVQTSHQYALSGTYNVTLVVTDDSGKTATSTQSLTILTDNPVADFTFVPATPTVGVAIAFNGSASAAVPGRTIVSYSWSFGDGTGASGVAVSKTYATTGTRNVTLTVTDNTGKTGSTTKPVTVQ
ncbi:MAG TPA: PKD domain-containing protein [Vicinamibacterales bacterium]|nr:PKD domain-containing protein [Vicinamibacterales bacterium]